MNIILKDKFLYFQNYKLRCAIGKSGISHKKKKGDNKTPKGKFKLKYILYRSDRVRNLQTHIIKKKITKDMGWCDDPSSKKYNKLIKFPFSENAERLWLKNNIYDIILITNYNSNPTIKLKGSAIFLHIAKKNYQSTKGCVAISKKNMRLLASKIKKNSKLIIY